jgi:hypothetical protein
MMNKRHFVKFLLFILLFSFQKMAIFSKATKKSFPFAFFPLLIKSNHSKTCRIINKPVESNDSTPSHNFEFPIYQAEEEGGEDCDILYVLARFARARVENPRATSRSNGDNQPWHKGREKEVKIGATLGESIKERLVKLL